ncbi:N-acetylmuramoyl-L-alanine amidase, partial [Rickettsiales bacterium]|nr:N-acetylmuramoyl-L-alanine amidase [Rickettsiales bacterium]
DSGAIGINRIFEKNVTLAVAKKLKKKLEENNFKVILTRNNDFYIKLRKRVSVARDNKSDLFISLHADYHKNKNINGVSVYTLSEKASDKEAEALARRENKEDLIEGLDLSIESKEVTNILIDLAQRETMNQSSYFVNFLLEELKHRTKLLQRTHRFAGFAVLKAPDIPSVLIEMGYLSNRNDAKLLTNSNYHDKLVEGITKAIERYFSWKEIN